MEAAAATWPAGAPRAELCETVGADVRDVTEGLGYHRRIGQAFLSPVRAGGGSCLPKDMHALLSVCAASAGGSLRGVRIGLLGLTFKAGTADLRDSPAPAVAEPLRGAGAELVGNDPAVDSTMVHPRLAGITIVDDATIAAKGADVLVILTEWPRFRAPD